MRRIAGLVLVLIAASGHVARAQVHNGGDPMFDLSAGVRGFAALTQPFTLEVYAVFGGECIVYAVPGVLRLALPPGLDAAGSRAGVRTLAFDSVATHEIALRADVPGTYPIRVDLSHTAGDRRWESSFDVIVTCDDQGAAVTSTRARRHEVRVGKQLYRCGGEALVPIERSEDVLERDIIQPRPRHREVAYCDLLGDMQADSIALTVLVDRKGRVMDVLPLPGGTPVRAVRRESDHVVYEPVEGWRERAVAAAAAARRWTFHPARVNGHTVADLVGVRVEVRSR